MSRLKGAAMGAGYFSRFQYEAWSRMPEVELAAIYNRTEEKARAIMAQYGVARYYGDWREMIDQRASRFRRHHHAAGNARRDVRLCRHPAASTSSAKSRSRRHWKPAGGSSRQRARRGVRFMVHENWRWQPWYREIKRIQRAGTVGEFTHIHFPMRMGDGWGENAYLDRQPFFRDYPRLLVYETGVHFIDTFRYLLGEITEVYAHLRRLNPVIRGEETGQVFFRFANGATAIWDANRYNEVESPSPRYTFGQMRIDAMGGHITLDTEANLRIKPLGQSGSDIEYPHRNVNFAGDCVYALQRHFVDSMRTGEEFEANGDDYLKTLAVVDAVYESARTGKVVGL